MNSSVRAIDRPATTGRSGLLRRPNETGHHILGTGNALFMGGVAFITSDGQRRVLVPPVSPWIWPAIASALAVASLVPLFFTNEVVLMVMCAVGALTFGAGAVLAYFIATRQLPHHLVIDAQARALREMEGPRVAFEVPAGAVLGVRVFHFIDNDDLPIHDVFVQLGHADFWVHQHIGRRPPLDFVDVLRDALAVSAPPSMHTEA